MHQPPGAGPADDGPRDAVRRRSGGNVGGGCRRGGRPDRSSAVAAVTRCTASSNAPSVRSVVDCTPLTFRTYCLAAASISSGDAAGCSPLRVVMLRHMAPGYAGRSGRGPSPKTAPGSPTISG